MSEHWFTILQITYTALIPILLASIKYSISKHLNANDNGKKADMLILRLCLIDMHDRYMAQGYISRESYDTFDEIWTLYTEGYKGNHLTEKFKSEVDTLELRG